MAGMNGVSGYSYAYNARETKGVAADHRPSTIASAAQAGPAKETPASKTECREFSPIKSGSPMIPQKTEYGMTIGDVKLSDKAADYLKSLKGKFGNMEFITVSKDMKEQVQKNAAAYGNANKMVVLVDDEKLERMATDEAFRKKYEGIIAMSQSKLQAAKNSLTSSGANVKNFGMSVDSEGKESFFATVEKAAEQQKHRIEKKAAEKKEQKLKEKKRAEKKAAEERIREAREKKAEKDDNAKKAGKKDENGKITDKSEEDQAIPEREYVTFEGASVEELASKVSSYSFRNASARVMTETERLVGSTIDFRG